MKIVIRLLWVLACAIFSGGCWDAKDIGKVDIPLAVALDLAGPGDMVKPDDRLVITYLEPTLTKNGEKENLLEASGRTPGDTRSERANRSLRPVSINEIRTILFGQGLAEEGLSEYLDIVYRNPFLSYQINLAVAEGRAGDIFTARPKTFSQGGEALNSLLEFIPTQNFVPRVTLVDFRNDLYNFGTNPVMPILAKAGESDIEISGIAVFKKERMVGKFDKVGMKYLTLLRGDEARGVITFPIPGKKGESITLQGTNSRKVKVNMEGGRAQIAIEIDLITDLIESQDFIIDRQLDRIEMAEQGAAENIVAGCREVLSRLQEEYRLDAINTGAAARARYGKKIVKYDWDELFANADINITARVEIRNHGAIK